MAPLGALVFQHNRMILLGFVSARLELYCGETDKKMFYILHHVLTYITYINYFRLQYSLTYIFKKKKKTFQTVCNILGIRISYYIDKNKNFLKSCSLCKIDVFILSFEFVLKWFSLIHYSSQHFIKVFYSKVCWQDKYFLCISMLKYLLSAKSM